MKKNNKKVYIKDTIKNITKNPEAAMKADYEQTKADMKNIKNGMEEKIDEKKNEWGRE